MFSVFFISNQAVAQLGFCTGNSGDPIFTETFGTGISNTTLPAGTTTYPYSNGFPNDGFYTVTNGSFGNGFDWHQTEDHTTGDTNGKCLVVNASAFAGEFYRTTVSGLCESTTYEFSAWLLNLVIANSFCDTTPTGTIPINVNFEIWDTTDTNLLASGNTGNIVETSMPNWEQYSLVFQTNPGETSVILKMINNGIGGCGNDLAIDDIIFKSCGDFISIEDDANNNNITICSSETPYSTTLTVTPDGSVFDSQFYQWQQSNDGISWADIAGETLNTIAITGITANAFYRAKVAESVANVNVQSCNVTSEVFEVLLNPATVSTFSQVSSICLGETLAALPSTSLEGVSGIWSPALNNTSTTTYTFTPFASQCGTSATMTITVNASTAPTFTQIPAICNGETLVALPTTSIEGFIGSWSPAIDNTTTTAYTFTPFAGQCANNASMIISVDSEAIPTFTQVPPICSGESLAALPTTSNEGITGTWSPALNNTTTTTYIFTPDSDLCATSTTMVIGVTSASSTLSFAQVPPVCSGETFSLPSSSNEGVTGTWSPTINNTNTTTYTFTPFTGSCGNSTTMTVEVNTSETPTFTQVEPICSGEAITLPTTSNEGVLGSWSPALDNTTTTTYTFTAFTAQCVNTAEMTIVVNSGFAPTFTQVVPICSGDNSAVLPTTSNEGVIGSWSPALDNTATTTYTFTPNTGQCATTATMTVTVEPLSTVTFTQVPAICSGDTLPPMPATSNEGITGTWSPAIDNITTTTYTFTPNAGQCAETGTMVITVNPQTIPTFTQVLDICLDETLMPLPTTSNEGIIGTWSPELDNTMTTTYTFTPDSGQCATDGNMTINVSQLISYENENLIICEGETLTLQPITIFLSPTYFWNSGETTPTLDITEGGIYTVAVTEACHTVNFTYTIEQIDAPVIESVQSNGNDIVVITSNTGIFEYSIDGLNYQFSNVFPEINKGFYTIYVKANTCNIVDTITHVHYYIPQHFSPNNDGNLDTFDLRGIEFLGETEVYIYDRFGKLLKSTKNVPFVWNGTFNGNPLPQSDYWYVILINGERIFGNVTLKR